MTKLFAAHLAQKTPRIFLEGEYDLEQDLWVSNNQLQGSANAVTTVKATVTQRDILTGFTLDPTLEPDTGTDPDV